MTMQLTSTIALDDSLEGYISASLLYEGAETFVYRALDAKTSTRVVVKVTKNEYPTAREVARLRREFAILRDLDVPHTPRARRLEERGRGLALVMDDIGFGTLRELLDSGRPDLEAALEIAISLSSVLAAVHRRGILHKDITPRNVVVDEAKREVYLIDFGISARLSQEMHLPGGPSGLEGTLVYIAPEQTGRMNRAVDVRADLYSFGVVLYELLTGSVPFPAADAAELIHSHLARPAVPPHEREPSVPAPLSEIVMTLLAKTPEERYQSDAGLRADLVECLRQWKEKGKIEPFALRRFDKATEIRRPQRLYGRERDVEALVGAFERTRLRGPELVLVSGYSGIGKSALVNELHKFVVGGRGYFVSGKFDQLSQEMPLAPAARAFRDLIRQILAESAESLEAWRRTLLGALAGNGRLITDLVPELELVIGPQPELPALSPAQAKNRFELTLQNFLDAFASAEHPLVLFLDDLQWIDPASVNLMKLLLLDAYSPHLLIVGAYRDNEVGPGHPLSLMLDELRRKNFRPTDVHLGPLDAPTVRRLVADALTSDGGHVANLAALIHDKTQGNPFFVYQFMVALKDEGLLRFDAVAGEWQWEDERVRTADVTDNVVDLMVGKLRRLSPATRQTLSLAACVGHSFDLRTLSTIGERPLAETAAALWEAMREGYVIALDRDYRLLEGAPPDLLRALDVPDDFNVRYRFLHDRILHAAYQLVADGRRRELHLSIGRLLRNRAGDDLRDEDLLEVVRHLNLGAASIDGHAERLGLARLNLRAGRRARAATAWSAASDYFRAGIGLLRESDWGGDYDLSYALHVDGAECAYLTGNDEQANAFFNTVIPRAKTDLERAAICRTRVYILYWSTKYNEAMAVGGEGLTHLGYPWNPEDLTSQEVFAAELEQVYTNLGGRRVEDLIDAPEISDPKLRATLDILDAMGQVAYQLGQAQFGVVVLKSVNVALKHGNTDACAFPYGALGLILSAVLGKVDEGLPFAMLALEILKKYPNAMHVPRTHIVVGTSCALLVGTMRDVERHCNIVRDTGLAVGNLGMAAVGCFLSTAARVELGDQLDDVIEGADKHLVITRRGREEQWIAAMVIVRQVVLNLLGRTQSRSTLSDDEFDEEGYVGGLAEPLNGIATFQYWTLKAQLHYLYGEYAEAMAAAEKADQRMMFGGGNPLSKVLPFYLCLAALAAPPAATPEAAERRAELLSKYRAQLDALAAGSAAGWSYQKALVDAEAARAAGDFEQAVRCYEQAITLAQEHKVPHIEALANELCAKLFLRMQALKAASAYMRDAYRAYLHWGAKAKASMLEAEYGYLMPALERDRGKKKSTTTSTGEATHSTILSRTTLGSLRDAALILRATEAIAGEIDLPKVIERLAALMLENAGAQRGALILARDGELLLTALFGDASSAIAEGHGRPLADGDEVPSGVVRYVARTQEGVVLDDAGAAARFGDDPYVAAGAPKSLLCLPLTHQSRLSGVLYLENRAIAGVFDAARVELLALLSAQAAIAIENAHLIASVRAAHREVRRANERLGEDVARRTEELARANADLVAAKNDLERELARREQVEGERAALREQVIEAQRAHLAEMSTPVIPITDEVLVMPLIGTVDRERAQQVLSAALEGAQRHRARAVILDVTGIKQIDTYVAGTLLSVVGALRLLGAEAVITGIAPDVATTLVGLGVDFTAFVTMGTLQSGMDYALRRARNPGPPGGRPRR